MRIYFITKYAIKILEKGFLVNYFVLDHSNQKYQRSCENVEITTTKN